MNYEDIALDIDKLEELESTLRLLRQTGFSSLSSPVSLLLEAALDISLRLGIAFNEGRPSGRRKNPSIIFLERAKANVLGNSPQVTRYYRVPEAWDPEAAEFFVQLARFFAFMRQNDNIFSKKEFMSFMDFAGMTAPPAKQVVKQRNQKQQKSSQRKANYFYYRRRMRK